MSTSIRIEFDADTPAASERALQWPVGAVIRGKVLVHAPDGQKARGVGVGLRWSTRGRGTRDSDTVEEIGLHQGDVPAGVPQEYAFELPIPEDGPITYDGHLIQIRWEIRAAIDIPWGSDVASEQEITIVPR